MWTPYTVEKIGFLNQFSDSLAGYQRRTPNCFPDLRSASGLVVCTDYGGEHSESHFYSYAILITTEESLKEWLIAREIWRQKLGMKKRRLSYKKLSDGVRQASCYPYLRICDLLEGVLFSVQVHKSVGSFFALQKIDRSEPFLQAYSHIKPDVLEKLFRVLHLIGFFIGGLSCPNQNLLWISDEDAIMANENRLVELRNLIMGVFSLYLRHDMGHMNWATTKSDPGDLSIEDLVSLPDIVVGAVTEVESVAESRNIRPKLDGSPLEIPPEARKKTDPILFWLSQPRERLSKMVFTIYSEEGSPNSLRILKKKFISEEPNNILSSRSEERYEWETR